MVCAEQRPGDGQKTVANAMKDVTLLEGKAGTFVQQCGKFGRIPTTDPVLVGLVVGILCKWNNHLS